jgi:hypothetical protein
VKGEFQQTASEFAEISYVGRGGLSIADCECRNFERWRGFPFCHFQLLIVIAASSRVGGDSLSNEAWSGVNIYCRGGNALLEMVHRVKATKSAWQGCVRADLCGRQFYDSPSRSLDRIGLNWIGWDVLLI